MNARTLLTLTVVFASAVCSNSANLSPEKALARLQKNNSSRAAQTSELKYKGNLNTAAKSKAYIFTDQTTGKNCLVASDSRAEAMLGYDITPGTGEMPPALADMLDYYAAECASLTEQPKQTTVKSTCVEYPGVEPLLKTIWGQKGVMNSLCPEVNGQKTPVGCVALALAQCMRHAQWPENGKGSISYYNGSGTTRQQLKMNFDTVQFNWDLIADNYWLPSTQAQRDEAAKALYAIGVACKMQYNPSGSSSSLLTAATALCKYFDYAESVCYYERDYFEYDKWESKIYNELAQGRPVPYAGNSTLEGHAFVIDGYRAGGYFHVLWGWDGEYDGWYKLTALHPGAYNVRMKSAAYESTQSMITGMVPPAEYVKHATHLRITGNFAAQLPSTTRTAGAEVTFRGENGIFSMAYAKSTVTLGVKLVDDYGNTSHLKATTTKTFSQFSAVQTFKIKETEFPDSGTYTVTPAFLDSHGQWNDIHTPLNRIKNIHLTCTPEKLVFAASPKIPNLEVQAPVLNSPVKAGGQYNMESAIYNSGEEFLDKVYPVVLHNGSIVGRGTAKTVNIETDELTTISFTGTVTPVGSTTLEPGYYSIALAKLDNSQYVVISPETDTYVGSATESPLIVSSSAVKINGTHGESTSTHSPIHIAEHEVELHFDVNCHQGYFGQHVGICIYHPDRPDNPVLTLGDQFMGLDEGETRTATFSVSLSALEPGTVYTAEPWASTSGMLHPEPTYFRIGTTDADRISNNAGTIATEIYTLSGINVGNSTHGLTPGIYIVKTVTDDGTVKTEKVMI